MAPILLKATVVPGRKPFDRLRRKRGELGPLVRDSADAYGRTAKYLNSDRLLAPSGRNIGNVPRLVQLGVPIAGAENPTIDVVEAPQRESAAFDIAIALGDEDAEDFAEPAAYTQPLETADVDAAAEQSIVEAPADSSAEEVAPSEEIERLDRLEGPPTWDRILRPITEVTADATLPAGLLPEQVEHQGDAPRAEMRPQVGDPRFVGGWGESSFAWSATKSWHRPLYFEEVNLERYGYQCHPVVQPLVSGAHFFLTVPTLPYQVTAHPPRECIYTLGHYRPGNCVPWQRHCLPWDPRAAAVQAGVVVGLVFLIP